jgi:hypothetical protein
MNIAHFEEFPGDSTLDRFEQSFIDQHRPEGNIILNLSHLRGSRNEHGQ